MWLGLFSGYTEHCGTDKTNVFIYTIIKHLILMILYTQFIYSPKVNLFADLCSRAIFSFYDPSSGIWWSTSVDITACNEISACDLQLVYSYLFGFGEVQVYDSALSFQNNFNQHQKVKASFSPGIHLFKICEINFLLIFLIPN